MGVKVATERERKGSGVGTSSQTSRSVLTPLLVLQLCGEPESVAESQFCPEYGAKAAGHCVSVLTGPGALTDEPEGARHVLCSTASFIALAKKFSINKLVRGSFLGSSAVAA